MLQVENTFFPLFNIYKNTLMAVGALESVTNVPAASYRTAGLLEFNRLYMHRINRDRSDGFA